MNNESRRNPPVVRQEQDWTELQYRQAAQTIRHREVLLWVVLCCYLVALVATFALIYLAGFGIVSYADNVLIALSGVLIGEVGIGAVLLQMVKSIFE